MEHHLQTKLRSLKNDFDELQDRLRETLERLEEGAPPDKSTAGKLLELSMDFDDVRNAANMAVGKESPSLIRDLDDLEELIEEVTPSYADLYDQVETRLRRLSRVVDEKSSDGTALQPVRKQTQSLLAKVEEPETARPHSEIEEFSEDQHPLSSFEALVFREDELSDKEWREALEEVEEHFPQEVSTAAVRRRVRVKSIPDGSTGGDQEERSTEEPSDQLSVDEGDKEPESDEEDQEKFDSSAPDQENQTSHEGSSDRGISTDSDSDLIGEDSPEEDLSNVEEVDIPKEPDHGEIEDVGHEDQREQESEGGDAEVESNQQSSVETDEPKEPRHSDGEHSEEETPVVDIPPNEHGSLGALAERVNFEGDIGKTIKPLIWSLLHHRLDSLALRLVRDFERRNTRILPSQLIRDFVLGPHLRGRNGKIAQHLQFAETTEAIQKERLESSGLWLLAFSASIRPALHAPAMTSSLDILEALQSHNGPEILHRILREVKSFIDENNYRPISRKAFIGSDQQSVEDELKAFQVELEKWVSNTQKRSAPYWKATQAWRAQFDRGPIASIVDEIIDSDNPSTKAIRRVKNHLDDLRALDAQRAFQQSTNSDEELEGSALKWLRESFSDFEARVKGWIDLAEQHTSDEDSLYRENSQLLVEKLKELMSETHRHLSDTNDHSPTTAIAVQRTLEVIDGLNEDLGGSSFDHSEASSEELLYRDLLRIPDLKLGSNFAPQGSAEENIKVIVRCLQEGYPTWENAFEEHAARGDHRSTGVILRYLRQDVLDSPTDRDVDFEELSQRRDEDISVYRRKIDRHVDDVRNSVERAFRSGYLDQGQRAEYLSRVRSVGQKVESTAAFHKLQNDLESIDSNLKAQKRRAVQEVEERFRAEEVQEALEGRSEDRERIQRSIEREDVRTADAYIQRVLSGQEIPEPVDSETALEDFFPERLQAIIEDFGSPEGIDDLLRVLKSEDENDHDGPLDLGLDVRGQKRSAEIIETWLQAQRKQKITEEGLREILVGLGFSPNLVELDSLGKSTPPGRKSRWAKVELDIPPKRDVPVPQYGSNTGGEYRVLIAYGNPSVEELADDVEHLRVDEEKAMMAFYFGQIDERERRQLSSLCRERRTDFIVLDQALLLFLLTQPRSSRLRTLFECTLPFSFLQPYSESASRIPREMFYGREREIEKLHRADGPSIVYGGRQLGKTVLLRRAQRLFHNPPNRVSSWVDLRRYGIGTKDPKSVWPIIVDELKELGVFENGQVHRDTKPSTISRKIESWISEEKERRILLLLDEADSFFSKDQRQGFEQTSALKGLMEATDGRFKVVFAGLHNVLRTTSAPNQPLAHLREPICVGPLLEEGEWKSARDLVSEPLHALGYRFEPKEDLITYILSLTNYYPSLIQLYCRHLLEGMSDHTSLSQPEGPPYTIGRTEVQHSSEQRELMRQIRDKFLLTLQLDPRYEVLAYVIGYETRKADRDIAQGFEVDWIANQARELWSEGFRGSDSRGHVQALLEEMVGLGVLRNVEDKRFALRSPNVLPLLGDIETMEEVLLKDRSPIPEYDPKTHRRLYGKDNKLAPLTEHQHSLLKRKGAWPQSSAHGVAVIHGTIAAGLEEVQPFLEKASSDDTFYAADDMTSAQKFSDWMADKKEGRSKNEVTLLFVPPEVPWGEGWVEQALRQTDRLRDQRAALRIAFLADPEHTSTICQEGHSSLNPSSNDQVIPIQLQPWHGAALRDWLVERGKKPTETEMRHINRVTGNWPLLLRKLEGEIRRDPGSLESEVDALDQKLENPEVSEDLLEKFGLPESIRRKVLWVLALLDTTDSKTTRTSEIGVSLNQVKENTGEVHGEVVASRVEPVLRWASLVGVASTARRNKWSLDPTVGRLLLNAEE